MLGRMLPALGYLILTTPLLEGTIMIIHFIDEELAEWGNKMTFSGTYSLPVAKPKYEIVSLAVEPWLLTPGLGPQARKVVEVKGAFTFTGFLTSI